MPDLGKVFVGSMWDLAISTGLRLDSTWAGQNLSISAQVTRSWFLVDCKTNDTMVTQRGDPLYRSEEAMVMVQEDQAEEPWSLVRRFIYSCRGL